MNFKVGDRVSFLNEKGGGVITKIISHELVHVADSDGFEIPVLTREIIKAGLAEASDDIEKAFKRLHPELVEEEPEDEDISPIYFSHNNPDQRAQGVYFAIVPEIQETPLVGSLDLFLINHTPFNLLYNLFLNHSGGYQGQEYGFLAAESKVFLGQIGRSEIEKWANSLIQTLFFQEGKCTPLPAFGGLISFRPIKIYKEESFVFESLLRKKALVVEACTIKALEAKPLFEQSTEKQPIELLKEKLQTHTPDIAKPKASAKSFLDKHKIDDSIAEVDLHIGELVDNFTNLEKADLLNIQLDYFKKCLEQAEKEHLSKIIFIHGIGNGKLKTEITKHLEKTNGIAFHDAPFARYGMGATEVVYYRNK